MKQMGGSSRDSLRGSAEMGHRQPDHVPKDTDVRAGRHRRRPGPRGRGRGSGAGHRGRGPAGPGHPV